MTYQPRDPYETVICDECGNCGAQPGDKCVNKITGLPAHCPCVARLRKEVNA